jgi:hypothetical protein
MCVFTKGKKFNMTLNFHRLLLLLLLCVYSYFYVWMKSDKMEKGKIL